MQHFYFKGLKIRYEASLLTSDRAIILCPGLPTSFASEERITLLTQRGFHVFYVLYPGYPNSSMIPFLSQNPAKLISDFITSLRTKGINGIFPSRFFLIGNSFGGSVALDIPNADKIVAISPIVDYKNLYKGNPEHNYKTLKSYLVNNGYKINNSGWNKLKNGELFDFSGVAKGKTLVVYGKNDTEINPATLGKLLKTKNIESVCIDSDKHLSFKNIQSDIFENIMKWLEKTNNIIKYNDLVDFQVKKMISMNRDSLSGTLIGGSLASGNLVTESDVDIYLISEQNVPTEIKKIKNHDIESAVMSFDDYANYIKSNMRGLSKLFSSKLITDNQYLGRKIGKFKTQAMGKYKDIFLIFQLLENKRMESIKFIDAHSKLAIKKRAGGRRSLGFMAVTFNALNDIYNPSFWNTLELMVASGAITRTDREYIERFFDKLIGEGLGRDELDELFKDNDKIVTNYINNYFVKEVNKIYKLGLTVNKTKISVNAEGFIGDLVNAFYSKNSEQLVKLSRKYKNCKDAIKKHTIFYYLALNSKLPFEVAEFIAINFANEYSMYNVRRNLVENDVTMIYRKLLHLLANDPDPKVRFYVKKKLKQDNILRTKIMRYPS